MGSLIDLKDKKFGKWTVIERDPLRKGEVYWICSCSCGAVKSVSGKSLRESKSLSCGNCNKLDIIGKTFGEFTILDIDKEHDSKKNHCNNYICRCSCGKIKSVSKTILNLNHPNCGCKTFELMSKKKIKNIEGLKFGKLTVLSRVKNINRRVAWECFCECGNKTIVLASNLVNKRTISCGCILSKGELIIGNILRENNLKFITQFTPNNFYFSSGTKPKFDFAILNDSGELNYLIEYDGIQHFVSRNDNGWNTDENLSQTLERDNQKNIMCLKNKIPLIRIPYFHKNIIIDDLLIEKTKFLIMEDNNECL